MEVEKNVDTLPTDAADTWEDGTSPDPGMEADLSVTSPARASSSCGWCSCCGGVTLGFLAFVIESLGPCATSGFALPKTAVLVDEAPSAAAFGEAGDHSCPLE